MEPEDTDRADGNEPTPAADEPGDTTTSASDEADGDDAPPVVSDIARDAGLARNTASDYITLLQALNLVVLVEPWASSATTGPGDGPRYCWSTAG